MSVAEFKEADSGRKPMNDALAKELIAKAVEDSTTRERLVAHGELKDSDYHPAMRAVHERATAESRKYSPSMVGCEAASLTKRAGMPPGSSFSKRF